MFRLHSNDTQKALHNKAQSNRYRIDYAHIEALAAYEYD